MHFAACRMPLIAIDTHAAILKIGHASEMLSLIVRFEKLSHMEATTQKICFSVCLVCSSCFAQGGTLLPCLLHVSSLHYFCQVVVGDVRQQMFQLHKLGSPEKSIKT